MSIFNWEDELERKLNSKVKIDNQMRCLDSIAITVQGSKTTILTMKYFKSNLPVERCVFDFEWLMIKVDDKQLIAIKLDGHF